MKKNVYFVSGIDTNIGKSYATAYLAKTWNERGIRTITEKLIQTGNTDMSEDIELHRRIMGTGLLPEDRERLTMPEIFSYPCSPHLAAEIDKRPIDFDKIERATQTLSERYDAVLLEGAGGLMVPLTRELLTIDYVSAEAVSAGVRHFWSPGKYQPHLAEPGSDDASGHPSAYAGLQPFPGRR